MRQSPQAACGFQRLKAVSRPPVPFLAGAVQFTVMRPAKRNCEFIADLVSKSAGLCETQVVRVAGLATADEAGLCRHKAQMLFVPQPLGFGQGQHALVDAGRGLVARCRSIRFGWQDVLIRSRFEVSEPCLKSLSDVVPILWRQPVYLWPYAQCPAVQIVVLAP